MKSSSSLRATGKGTIRIRITQTKRLKPSSYIIYANTDAKQSKDYTAEQEYGRSNMQRKIRELLKLLIPVVQYTETGS